MDAAKFQKLSGETEPQEGGAPSSDAAPPPSRSLVVRSREAVDQPFHTTLEHARDLVARMHQVFAYTRRLLQKQREILQYNPARRERKAEQERATPTTAPAPSLHLLLVEDNPGDIVLFREALRELPVSVHLSVATTEMEALQVLYEQTPSSPGGSVDLVVLDINLPSVNGFELLAELQRDPARWTIPTVVLTSSANPSDINRCYEFGANAYMTKPLGLDDYVRTITATVLFWQACQFRTLPGTEHSR